MILLFYTFNYVKNDVLPIFETMFAGLYKKFPMIASIASMLPSHLDSHFNTSPKKEYMNVYTNLYI